MVIFHSYVSLPEGTDSISKAYFSGLFFREYPQKIWPKIWYSNVLTYLHLLDPEDLPLI